MILQLDHPSTKAPLLSFTVSFLSETVLLMFLKASMLVMDVKKCMFGRLLTTNNSLFWKNVIKKVFFKV